MTATQSTNSRGEKPDINNNKRHNTPSSEEAHTTSAKLRKTTGLPPPPPLKHTHPSSSELIEDKGSQLKIDYDSIIAQCLQNISDSVHSCRKKLESCNIHFAEEPSLDVGLNSRPSTLCKREKEENLERSTSQLTQAPLFCLVPPTEMRKPPRPIARRIDGVGKSPSAQGVVIDSNSPETIIQCALKQAVLHRNKLRESQSQSESSKSELTPKQLFESRRALPLPTESKMQVERYTIRRVKEEKKPATMVTTTTTVQPAVNKVYNNTWSATPQQQRAYYQGVYMTQGGSFQPAMTNRMVMIPTSTHAEFFSPKVMPGYAIGTGAIGAESCKVCGSRKPMFVCSLCRLVWYCSKACQVSDWQAHSNQCTETSQQPSPNMPRWF